MWLYFETRPLILQQFKYIDSKIYFISFRNENTLRLDSYGVGIKISFHDISKYVSEAPQKYS